MTEADVKDFLIGALEYANVIGILEHHKLPDFLGGIRDITFRELDMDSLATMELCISIELSTGLSISPEDLIQVESLKGLVLLLQSNLQ